MVLTGSVREWRLEPASPEGLLGGSYLAGLGIEGCACQTVRASRGRQRTSRRVAGRPCRATLVADKVPAAVCGLFIVVVRQTAFGQAAPAQRLATRFTWLCLARCSAH